MPLKDLANCMLTCKEWRSLIDTCHFWKYYVSINFDFGLAEPSETSPLYEWKNRSTCLKADTRNNNTYPSVSSFYVFKPFPDLWMCNVIVPYALAPPQGSVEIYHNFLKAMRWLQKLDEKLQELNANQVMHGCLIPWFKDRLPTSREVLAILGAHKEIVRTLSEAKPLTKQEMKLYYGMLKNKYRGPNFNNQLYEFTVNNVTDRTIIFDCNVDIVAPVPSFILTKLSPGWVGGLLYSI